MSKVTLLVLGNLTGGTDSLYQVREKLVGIDGSFDEHVDAAIYTGSINPEYDRLELTPEDECQRLESLLGGLAADVPVYIVPGEHYEQGTTASVLRHDEYAPASSLDDAYIDEFSQLQYVPLDDIEEVGSLPITQNPALLEDEGILLMHSFLPELYDYYRDSDGPVYVSGSGFHGRIDGNSLNTMFTTLGLGPGADAVEGGFYLIDVDSTGITNVQFEGVDAKDIGRCEWHADRGRLQTSSRIGCPFCRDQEAYFEELLRESAAKQRQAGERTRMTELIGSLLEEDVLNERQQSEIREYALGLTTAENVFGGQALGGRKNSSSETRNPSDVVDKRYLFASSELGFDSGDLYAYYSRHNVLRKRDTSAADLPEPEDKDQRELDQIAYYQLPQGEWLLFPNSEDVSAVWERIVSHVADGTFYDARVGTEWTRLARGNQSHAILVAVPNYFDFDDVRRVYNRLRQIEGVPVYKLSFKPLLYSMYGIDSRNYKQFGLPRATRYSTDDF
ncbi:hypothetical protein AUR64_04075 [Haloprofundus marisrubri]|uniref:Calcineurin-like phosphoesterase domain-containing protein n=1 Tax=Haloprofundus marisrubri TaxID=1514971 RepID=A0A0W1RE72_9EURY|nr:putative phosphothreonine lyase domain-containg protein [Haloprofundus marisrubri]KTG11440.1 hypothetical protein AUR64_04075 [Haloprofundus marisrubri]